VRAKEQEDSFSSSKQYEVKDHGEKIQHSLEELTRALNDFPSPNQMFAQVHQYMEEIILHGHNSEEPTINRDMKKSIFNKICNEFMRDLNC
jgi:hypothetical protein